MKDAKPDTILTHAGRDPAANHGIVNPPVYHASTVLFPTVTAMEAASKSFDGTRYGRIGTPTSRALEEAVAELEGAAGAIALPSGLAAITTALLAVVRTGDHLLVTDSVYGPTRAFCDGMLARLGIETTYYDPCLGAAVADLIRPNTRAVYVEAPGSLTFEIQDVPAIAAAARARGVLVMADNTWATPLFFRPYDHGVDITVHAATKYIVGHSDAMLGIITTRDRSLWEVVKRTAVQLGTCAGPDDIYLGLRGIRTLGVRLRQHQDSALTIARWLQGRPEVDRVLHPALPEDPGHALWRRDFRGASGLFGFVLKPVPRSAVEAMLDGLSLFGMGWSWGGFESLAIVSHVAGIRTARPWTDPGVLMRLHVGLEDTADLIADLERGFERLAAVAAADR